jgi:hypothetical protein
MNILSPSTSPHGVTTQKTKVDIHPCNLSFFFHYLLGKGIYSSVTGVRSYRGADCDVDHCLVITKLRLTGLETAPTPTHHEETPARAAPGASPHGPPLPYIPVFPPFWLQQCEPRSLLDHIVVTMALDTVVAFDTMLHLFFPSLPY